MNSHLASALIVLGPVLILLLAVNEAAKRSKLKKNRLLELSSLQILREITKKKSKLKHQ